MQNEHVFIHWMQHHHGLSDPTSRHRLANCRRVEVYEGDLDTQYATDRCADLLESLTYTRDDASAGRKVLHRIPINGDQSSGTATLIQLYVAFRDSQRTQAGSESDTSAASAADPVSIPPVRPSSTSRTIGTAAWPVWETPEVDAILMLAHLATPYVRFLHPDIVAALVEDTEQHRANWSAVLAQRDISPESYL